MCALLKLVLGMTKRTDIKNGEIFKGDGKGHHSVWTGGGVTHTAPSSTLFIPALPRVPIKKAEELFEKMPGFIAFRVVRNMGFVDFKTTGQGQYILRSMRAQGAPHVQPATMAMRRHQGHVLEEGTPGLAIDFDKDPASKRNRNYEAQQDDLKRKRREEMSRPYFCACCGSKALSLFKVSCCNGVVVSTRKDFQVKTPI